MAKRTTIPSDFEASHPYETEQTDAGVLVWDTDIDKVGKRLAGFTLVTDWDAMRSELARRGLDVGDIYHKETFSPTEVGL